MSTLDRRVGRGLVGVVVAVASAAWAGPRQAPPANAPPTLASAAVVVRTGNGSSAYEGVVEALRQTVIAAQVPGAVVALQVRAGDRVQADQVLMRIDARAAQQSALAGAAQSRAARAATEEATRSFGRQQELFDQGFISRAALDRAHAQLKTAEAETAARLASAGAAQTQSEWHVVRSPYAGVVAQVSVVLGDMALPGRPLLTLYDPSALRVTAAIPQSVSAALNGAGPPLAEVPGAVRGRLAPVRFQLLPVVDAASHTLELRMDLPAGTSAAPGMFARAWLPAPATGTAGDDARLFVPSEALVRRAELAAVYVIGFDGKPSLRQVRPGRSTGTEIEILSGVAAGERVALDPQAAARLR